MLSHHPIATLVLAGIAAVLDSSAAAQPCYVPERQFIPAFEPFALGEQFGFRVAVEGDHALVSAPGHDAFASNGGAVYALQRNQGQWSLAQTLGPGLVTASDRFGEALACDGAVAVVGVPLDNPGAGSGSGSAFVFRLVAGAWVFEQQLLADDPNAGDNFGASVAVDGDAIIIGAPGDDEGGSNAGAAYVFRFNGATWTREQKLLETGPAVNRRVGAAVTIRGDLAFVSRDEAVIMFRRTGGAWVQLQMLTEPQGVGDNDFGTTLDFEGGTLVVGSPRRDIGSAVDCGAAYVFNENAVMFQFAQELTAATPVSSERFGNAVAIDGDRIVIGVPQRDYVPFTFEPTTNDAGVVTVFRRQAGLWSEHFLGRAKARFNWGVYFDENRDNLLGTSVDISGDDILAGGPLFMFSDPYTLGGKACFFDATGGDCDGDGVPDSCETDCNFNLAPDECELADRLEEDCDGNGALDLCQNGFEYAIDNFMQVGAAWGAAASPLDMVWLNHFTVQPGGQRLTHVAIAWLAYGPAGIEGQVVIYADPNNDGHPSDAVLLATAPMSLLTDFGTIGDTHTVYRVPTTYVGEPGESFFIGGHMSLPPQTFVAVIDNAMTPEHSNWRVVSPPGGDITNLATGWTINVASGDWMVRGIAMDCNGNGAWDGCDIAAGTSLDANGNGIPDECDATCPADVNFSGAVDINDLLAVISGWGACPAPPADCPGDINNDNTVSVNDLLAVITTWGACP